MPLACFSGGHIAAGAFVMKKPLLVFSCIAIAVITALGEPKPKAVDLFNGRDLEGWTGYLVEEEVDPASVWFVRDGLLVCKGEPLGFLHTKEEYTNFDFEIEWRWAPGGEPGNNGVLMRINGGPQKGVPRCIEMQLKHGQAGELYGFFGMKVDGDADRKFEVENHELVGDLSGVRAIKDLEKEPGEWNHARILAEGGNFKVWINGELANEAHSCDVISGPIGIQSEGGEIHFRKIRVTSLP